SPSAPRCAGGAPAMGQTPPAHRRVRDALSGPTEPAGVTSCTRGGDHREPAQGRTDRGHRRDSRGRCETRAPRRSRLVEEASIERPRQQVPRLLHTGSVASREVLVATPDFTKGIWLIEAPVIPPDP